MHGAATPVTKPGSARLRCDQGSPLAFRETTPDSVRLVHLQGVRSAGGQRWALEAHGFRPGLAPGSGGPAFPLGMEEVRTRHPSAGGIELPVPQVRVRSGKSSGVGHGDPLIVAPASYRDADRGARRSRCDVAGPTDRRIADVSPSRRIRADAGATVEETLFRSLGRPQDHDHAQFFGRFTKMVRWPVRTGESRIRRRPFGESDVDAAPIGVEQSAVKRLHSVRYVRLICTVLTVVHRRGRCEPCSGERETGSSRAAATSDDCGRR